MKRNTSNWSNFCMLLRHAGLTASAGLSSSILLLFSKDAGLEALCGFADTDHSAMLCCLSADKYWGWIRHLTSPEHSKSPSEGCPRIGDAHPVVLVMATHPVADLQRLNLGLNSAWKYTQDREHWKHLVETATLQLGACSWWWWVFSMQQQTRGQNIAYIEFQFAWTLWHPFFRPSVRLSVTC